MEKKGNRKTFYHSTVSRRDFMKMLGLGSVGMGAAAIGLSPHMPFTDLDDIMSSEFSDRKLPFWVKEVDEPTVEIDYSQVRQLPSVYNSTFLPGGYGGVDAYIGRSQRQVEKTVEEIQTGVRPIQDLALSDAGFYAMTNTTLPFAGTDLISRGGVTVGMTPEELGIPKYQGTPEEASKMLRVVGRIFGAFDMGFVKLDDNNKKFLYGNVSFENVEEGYEAEDGQKVLPDKDLWMIVAGIPQSHFMGQFNSWGNEPAFGYSFAQQYAERMQTFLTTLGYQAYGRDVYSLGISPAFGVLAGLAEYGRTSQMVSPIMGTHFRTAMLTVTDLPLATTKPIDAGIMRFCKTCKKCAEECPSGAISMNDEPEWITEDTHQRHYQVSYGVKGYLTDAMKCADQMFSKYPHCGVCQTVCPFNKFDKASLHQIINGVIGTTPVANELIRYMDDVFGYGMKDAEETERFNIWEMNPWDVPLYGLGRV